MKCGLLYLSQESCLIGDVSYHNYEGLLVDQAGKERLARDLGVHNKVRKSSYYDCTTIYVYKLP